jgi:hypothetical protein
VGGGASERTQGLDSTKRASGRARLARAHLGTLLWRCVPAIRCEYSWKKIEKTSAARSVRSTTRRRTPQARAGSCRRVAPHAGRQLPAQALATPSARARPCAQQSHGRTCYRREPSAPLTELVATCAADSARLAHDNHRGAPEVASTPAGPCAGRQQRAAGTARRTHSAPGALTLLGDASRADHTRRPRTGVARRCLAQEIRDGHAAKPVATAAARPPF